MGNLGRLVKMTVLPKAVYTLSAVPVACFAEKEKPTVKFMWTFKRHPPHPPPATAQ